MTSHSEPLPSKTRLRELRKTVEHYARTERDRASDETVAELFEVAALLQSLESSDETVPVAPFPYPTDRDGWICSVCHGWNGPKTRVCLHSHLPPSLKANEQANTPRFSPAIEAEGMTWWNACTEAERAHWLKKAGSAAPADAWQAFRTSSSEEV